LAAYQNFWVTVWYQLADRENSLFKLLSEQVLHYICLFFCFQRHWLCRKCIWFEFWVNSCTYTH